MTAVIPAAGLGTRFLPVTRVVPKEMLPIGAKPALELIVDEAFAAGADEVVIVISEGKELIRRYFEDRERVRFVYQREQRGLGHAVLQAAEAVGADDAPLLVLLGDALVTGCSAAREMAALSARHDGAAVIGCEHVPAEKVSRYGILGLDGDRIVDMVEKPSPAEAPSDIAIAGRYLLPSAVFGFLRSQTPGKGGEIQLTDAIRRMLVECPAYAYVYPGRRLDIGNPDGYYEALTAFRAANPQGGR